MEMIPYPCEECLIHPICSRPCTPFFIYKERLEYRFFKLRDVIYTKNGNKRKHVKLQQKKHYRSYINKMATYNRQKLRMWRSIMGGI